MTESWLVYLVRCSDGSLYCGITTGMEQRLAAHNAGNGAKYTRSRLPVELAWSEWADSKSAALGREHRVKRMSRKQKLALIEQGSNR